MCLTVGLEGLRRGVGMKKYVWTVATVLIGAAVIAAIGLGFHNQQYSSPAGTAVAQPAGTTMVNGHEYPHVILNIATYPDSSGTTTSGQAIHPGGNPSWPAYGPTNEYQIPANAVVTVNWTQYDSGGVVNNKYFAYPHGTLGGTEKVNGKTVAGVAADNIGHTFTVRGEPGVDPGFFLSVPGPISKLGDNAENNKGGQLVQFSFISGKPGLYAWNCEFPCGLSVGGFGAVMSSFGYMSGYIHVV
jgi:hypothetical protein